MISDTERREVARKLAREAQAWRETFPDSECDFSDAAAMMQDLCVFVGLKRNALCSEVFRRLADLIDRPTCRKEERHHYYWRCSICGAFIYRDAVTDLSGVIPTNYCPNCGSEALG